MKSKTILSAEETLEILNSQWATVQDIMKIGTVGRNKARDIKNKIELIIKKNIITLCLNQTFFIMMY